MRRERIADESTSVAPPMPDRFERWPVGRLLPFAGNARTHGKAQVAQIAASISEFGFNAPCLVDADGVLVAGHGRLLAAKFLGLAEVPVVVLGHLTEAQARAYRIADNRLAMDAGWDMALLGAELEALRADAMDLSLLGFTEVELARLLSPAAADGEDDAPEPPAKPATRPGDLWLLGQHRLLCGDATSADDVGRALDGPAAMCFTDPPYNVNYAKSAKETPLGKSRPILNDDLGSDFGEMLHAACVNILAHTKGAIYICMSSSELHTLELAFREAGGHWSTFVIWAKNTFTMGRSDYQRQYEPILYGWKEGTDHYWCGARDQGDVWFVDKPFKNDLHPTMKPVALVERAIINSSTLGDVVLDPFAGAGSTLIAAARIGRQARLIELDPRYCDVVVRRWREQTGGTATLDGRTFEEVAAGASPAAA